LARWRTYKGDPIGRSKHRKRSAHQAEGPNQWLSPEFDSQQLAAALLRIYDPQSSPPSTTAHTLSCGTLPIPSPVVSNQAEAGTWLQGNRAVEAAFQADNDQATEPVGVPLPLPLFDGADSPST
jgi:hypothetical protein